jgi:plasmid stabilization system protein ParE
MRIRWTEPAARDLTHICDTIEEHDGPATARPVALTIYQGVGSLAQFWQRGRPGRKLKARELVFPGLPLLAVYHRRDMASAYKQSAVSIKPESRKPESGVCGTLPRPWHRRGYFLRLFV